MKKEVKVKDEEVSR